MTDGPAIEVRGLVKAFGVANALRRVDLTIEKGRFAVLLGPNGAGKTTLLRILATLSRPSAGDVKILGLSSTDANASLRRQLGLISHQLYLYPQLTAAENLRFFGKLYGLRDLDQAVERALAEVDLTDVGDTLSGGFSRGMLQRLSIARALIHRPSMVLLDEPFTGLDHNAASVLTELLQTLKDGQRTFVMVTHNLSQATLLGDEAFVLVRGRVAARLDLDADMTGDGLAVAYRAAVASARSSR